MQQISSKETGVYEIRNTHSGRSYVGQTVRFCNRWRKGYVNLLVKGKCHNEFLQHDFDRCKNELGHSNFLEFHILEVMNGSTKLERNIREEWWIQQRLIEGKELYNFNLEPTKDSSCSAKNPKEANRRRSEALRGKPLSIEHRQKLSAAKKGKPSSRKGAKWTEELRLRMLPIRQNQTHSTPPILKGKDHPKSKTYADIFLIAPDGQIFTRIECLRVFAKEHGLEASNLHHLLMGKIKSHKGWKIRQIHGRLVKVEA